MACFSCECTYCLKFPVSSSAKIWAHVTVVTCHPTASTLLSHVKDDNWQLAQCCPKYPQLPGPYPGPTRCWCQVGRPSRLPWGCRPPRPSGLRLQLPRRQGAKWAAVAASAGAGVAGVRAGAPWRLQWITSRVTAPTPPALPALMVVSIGQRQPPGGIPTHQKLQQCRHNINRYHTLLSKPSDSE